MGNYSWDTVDIVDTVETVDTVDTVHTVHTVDTVEEKLAKTPEIFGKRHKESRKNILPCTGKKMFAQKRGKQFYPLQENIIGAGKPTWACLERLG